METDRLTSAILSKFAWRLRRLQVFLQHVKRTLQNNQFDKSEWNDWNDHEKTEIEILYNQYKVMGNRNIELMNRYGIFHYYWTTVIYCFANHSDAWCVHNLNFIEERIVHSHEMEEMIREEKVKIDCRIARR